MGVNQFCEFIAVFAEPFGFLADYQQEIPAGEVTKEPVAAIGGNNGIMDYLSNSRRRMTTKNAAATALNTNTAIL